VGGGGEGGEGAIGDQGSASVDTSEWREGTANGTVYVRAGVYIITHVSHPFTWFPVPGPPGPRDPVEASALSVDVSGQSEGTTSGLVYVHSVACFVIHVSHPFT
jgi:hypothetical protein